MGFIYNSKILSDKECEFIKGYILKNESKVKSLGDDEYAFTKNDSLTGRYKIFNWLYTDIGDLLIPKLKMIFSQLNLKYPIAIQCWVNTFRKGEGIKKHMHLPYPGYKDEKLTSGHIFISGPEDTSSSDDSAASASSFALWLPGPAEGTSSISSKNPVKKSFIFFSPSFTS